MTQEQPIMGYVTSTTLDDGEVVLYGVFETLDKAHEFGSKLINHVAYTIYPPTLHQGDTMSYEPQLDDDIALGLDDEEELDEEFDEMTEIALERQD